MPQEISPALAAIADKLGLTHDEILAITHAGQRPKIGIADKAALSIDDCVELSDTGKTTIYQEIGAGHLVARKIRGRTVVLRLDFEAWLANLPRGTAPLPEYLKRVKRSGKAA